MLVKRLAVNHKHHLLPKYKGGTDHSSNLIEVSVTQHAMFHFCNWQLWGDKRDWLAWKGLTGEIGKEAIIADLRRLGLEKAKTVKARNIALHGITLKQYQANKNNLAIGQHLANSLEAREKRKKTFSEKGYQKGEKNSMFGTMWITNGTLSGNKKIPKGSEIPEGFSPGRTEEKLPHLILKEEEKVSRKKSKRDLIQNRLSLLTQVDLTSYRWVKEASKLLGLSGTSTRAFVDKYYDGEVYKRASPTKTR